MPIAITYSWSFGRPGSIHQIAISVRSFVRRRLGVSLLRRGIASLVNRVCSGEEGALTSETGSDTQALIRVSISADGTVAVHGIPSTLPLDAHDRIARAAVHAATVLVRRSIAEGTPFSSQDSLALYDTVHLAIERELKRRCSRTAAASTYGSQRTPRASKIVSESEEQDSSTLRYFRCARVVLERVHIAWTELFRCHWIPALRHSPASMAKV